MTTKTKRVILDKIIELSKQQDHIRLKHQMKNEERERRTQEEKNLINGKHEDIINLLEVELEFLKTLLFDLFE